MQRAQRHHAHDRVSILAHHSLPSSDLAPCEVAPLYATSGCFTMPRYAATIPLLLLPELQ